MTTRQFSICQDHQNAEWNQPVIEGTSCVLCRLFYLEAQESLLEEWQQRAKRAEDAIKEIERPLDGQMARLNATVVSLNGEIERLRTRSETASTSYQAVGYVNSRDGCTSTHYEAGRVPDGESMLYIVARHK